MFPISTSAKTPLCISGDTRPRGSSALGQGDGERGQLSQEPQQFRSCMLCQ
jgi:hypothetical protein